MLTNLSQLEHIVENKVCRFICDNDTPIHFVKEALFQFQKYIGQLEDQAKQQQEAAKQVTPPEVKEEKNE
jgi:hypothetical protein